MRATVVIELESNGQAARDLAAGGVFVPGCTLQLADECDVVVYGANQRLSLSARVVYVDERGGAGLELLGFSSELKAQLAELDPARPGELPGGTIDPDDDLAIAIAGEAATGEAPFAPDTLPEDTLGGEDEDEAAAELAHGDGNGNGNGHAREAGDDPRDDSGLGRRLGPSLHERLRRLTLAEQIKAAATGELHERIVLERLYGKNVWETLLRNPRLSAPEAARIARYGSLPRVLLEIIVANNAWLQVPEVRRALLSNPRLATDQVMKVLRLLPRHELKLAAQQTAYPQGVRMVARQLLRTS